MTKAALAGLETKLKKGIKKYGTPGASLAIWHDGKLHTAVAGVLNVQTGEKVRPESMFQIGSITKVLTATLVMQLSDKGLIDLNSPVRTYIPDFRIANLEASKTVTVKQLLDHSSGLAGDFLSDTGSGPEKIARYVDRCALLPLAHKVGKGFSYSNSAYTIAGRIIEIVTGLTYEMALKTYIFEPLELGNTLSDPPDIVGRSVSSGHSPDPENPNKSVRIPTIYTLAISGAPAGSTPVMSAEDLITFARTHLDGGKGPNGKRILKKSTTTRMQKKHNTIPVPARDISFWGLGWFLVKTPTGQLYGHDGGTVGQYSFLRVHKETGTIAVLLTNGGTANDLMMDVFAQTLDELTGVHPSPAPKAIGKLPDDVDKYVGIYRTVAGDKDIYIEDGKLMAKGFLRLDDAGLPEPPCELKYAGGTDFIMCRPPAKFPATYSFLQPNKDGIPQVLFTGLRVANRVN